MPGPGEIDEAVPEGTRTPTETVRSGRSVPFWFGPEERPLFGWLHLPESGEVRGGVVLCQPLGLEAICVYFSYRHLANRLAAKGLAVLRFDYDGTGDSAGEETDPDRTEAWLSSVSVATDALAGMGVGPIGMVGIRMGGLFAAIEAARRDDLHALVLWDPCVSGRAFLREQQLLRQASGEGGDSGSEGVEAPGIRFEAETVKTLKDLDLTRADGPLARRVLVLTPPEHVRPKALERRLEGAAVEWQDAVGQVALLDSQRQDPPYVTIERVTSWLSDTVTGAATPVELPVRASATLAWTGDGEPIEERTVTLGSLRLFGIVTEGQAVAGRPTVVLVNEGGTHHIGQARIWVDLARRLAGSGFRVVRFDLTGNGDSDVRPGQTPHVARAFEAMEDVRIAVGSISPTDSGDVVLIGFCSGAYQAVEHALVDPPRGIIVINPTFAFDPAEPAGTAVRPARQVPRRWFVAAATPLLRTVGRRWEPEELRRWRHALEVGTWPVAVAVRRPGIPDRVWSVVYRLLFERRGITSLRRVVDAGVDTMLIVGPHDLLPVSIGAERQFRALAETANFHLVQLDELEHASWTMSQRHLMISVIDRHLTRTFGERRPTPSNS